MFWITFELIQVRNRWWVNEKQVRLSEIVIELSYQVQQIIFVNLVEFVILFFVMLFSTVSCSGYVQKRNVWQWKVVSGFSERNPHLHLITFDSPTSFLKLYFESVYNFTFNLKFFSPKNRTLFTLTASGVSWLTLVLRKWKFVRNYLFFKN